MDEIEALRSKLEQAQLAYQMAAQMNEFKAGFLARTAHELRSPLNGLIGLHQLILSDLCESPSEEREFIQQANDSALKMVKLMDEIINVAKVEYGSNPLEMEAVNLAEVLGELQRLTSMQAKNRSIQLHFAIPEQPVCVMADFSRLRQALLNLVDNSLDKMKEGTINIHTSCNQAQDQVHIWIDLESPYEVWSEPVDLLEQLPAPKNQGERLSPLIPQMSSGMKFILSQNLLELMGGSLELVAVSPLAREEPLTRLQCSVPLAVAQT